jgi:hypothetical protein
LDSHVAYYENGANDGTPAGTYGGHSVKHGPSPREDDSEYGRQSTKDGTKKDASQVKMDAWLK